MIPPDTEYARLGDDYIAYQGEVLCSRTVPDLVVGSGVAFVDRGTRVLKGVPEEWQLFAVAAS